MRLVLTIAIALLAVPAYAQQTFEVAPLIGYTTAAPIDQTADDVDDLEIDDALTLGARAAYFVRPNLGVEVLWLYQGTSVSLSAGGQRAALFDMTSNHLFGNLVYQFGDGTTRWRPFLSGGAGAALYVSDGLESEGKFTWNVGGGVKWWMRDSFAIEGRAMLAPTLMGGAEDDELCGPFTFCQGSITQFSLLLGGVFRF
jgi:hypothetical protein